MRNHTWPMFSIGNLLYTEGGRLIITSLDLSVTVQTSGRHKEYVVAAEVWMTNRR
jgi:hypothetical protein